MGGDCEEYTVGVNGNERSVLRDLAEAFELRVPLVGTADNYADFLTKPLPAKTFFALRRRIMNEPIPAPSAAAASD